MRLFYFLRTLRPGGQRLWLTVPWSPTSPGPLQAGWGEPFSPCRPACAHMRTHTRTHTHTPHACYNRGSAWRKAASSGCKPVAAGRGQKPHLASGLTSCPSSSWTLPYPSSSPPSTWMWRPTFQVWNGGSEGFNAPEDPTTPLLCLFCGTLSRAPAVPAAPRQPVLASSDLEAALIPQASPAAHSLGAGCVVTDFSSLLAFDLLSLYLPARISGSAPWGRWFQAAWHWAWGAMHADSPLCPLHSPEGLLAAVSSSRSTCHWGN